MPIERLRMRPWLESALNEGKFPGVQWVNKEEKIFRLPWKHASRNGWRMQTDACLFRAWAEHTGKFKRDDIPNPKTWKANFRCALNSLPDMEELTEQRTTKGNNAFKMYRIITETTTRKGYQKKFKGRVQRKRKCVRTTKHAKNKDCDENLNGKLQLSDSENKDNVAHLMDHDYEAAKTLDIFHDTYDENGKLDFDMTCNANVKTEPLSPSNTIVDEELLLYEENSLDTKNMKESIVKEDQIMSDNEVIELIQELSNDGTPSENSMDEFLEDCLAEDCLTSGEVASSSLSTSPSTSSSVSSDPRRGSTSDVDGITSINNYTPHLLLQAVLITKQGS